MAPDLLEVVFSVFGEQGRERGFFREWCWVVLGFELFHLPVIDIIGIPGCIVVVVIVVESQCSRERGWG